MSSASSQPLPPIVRSNHYLCPKLLSHSTSSSVLSSLPSNSTNTPAAARPSHYTVNTFFFVFFFLSVSLPFLFFSRSPPPPPPPPPRFHSTLLGTVKTTTSVYLLPSFHLHLLLLFHLLVKQKGRSRLLALFS